MQRAVCESTLGESKDLQGSSGTAIIYSGFLHWFWPMSDPRPMAPSFLKTVERALPRLQREKTTWRDWR